MPPMRYRTNTMSVVIAGEEMQYRWHDVLDLGWFEAMPWRLGDLRLVQDAPCFVVGLSVGDNVELTNWRLADGRTQPPSLLKEAELVALMEKNGIGTDASIPQHIKTICERMYVLVVDENGEAVADDEKSEGMRGGMKGKGKTQACAAKGGTQRLMLPTDLGLALIDGMHARTRARTHAHTHARTHTRTHARTHACIHARTHACIHAHTHEGLVLRRWRFG